MEKSWGMGSKLGRVSIITPCYNGAKHIKETIDSVIAQTHMNWEMIVIDDGSVDGSAEIVKEYCNKESRIKLIQQKNFGSAAARNSGIRQAEGRYIALLDADDVWLPTFIEEQVEFLQENQAICVACAYDHINGESQPILHTTSVKNIITVKDMKIMNQIGCLSGLYDTEKYGKIYLREELKSLRDDYAYWYDIVSLEGKAYGNPKVLAKYRVLGNSTTGNKIKLIKKQYTFYRTYLKENPVEAVINLIRWGVAGLRKFL